MKDVAKCNLILYSIIPTIIFIIVGLIICILSKAIACFIFCIIIIAFELRRLRRNIRNLVNVQNKLDTIEEILYQNDITILSKDSIINIKFDFFTLDYCDIDNIWLDNVTVNTRFEPYIIVIVTKKNREYRIRFIDYLPNMAGFRNTYRYEIKKIIETIKLRNPDIKLYGKAKDMYENID